VFCGWSARVRTVPKLLSLRRFAPSPNNMIFEEVCKVHAVRHSESTTNVTDISFRGGRGQHSHPG